MARVHILFHDHCFDGSASAAVFSAFYSWRNPATEFHYQGLTHKATDLFEDADFGGDDNAIVDFKYSADPRVTWWFDHHQSAFLSPADAEHFQHNRSGQKFYDPSYGSCTKFIADTTKKHFGFDPSPLRELVEWADIIDCARFESAEAAVQLRQPALQLTLAIEASTKPDLLGRLIPDFLRYSLADLVKKDYVQRELEPLLKRHFASMETIKSRIDCRDGVIFFDLSDLDLEGYNKFIPYFFHPEGIYSIGISRSTHRMKVSVGTNPWHSVDNMKNLATLCERYGGGGHPRVGAISFPPNAIEEARKAALELVAELRHDRRAAAKKG